MEIVFKNRQKVLTGLDRSGQALTGLDKVLSGLDRSGQVWTGLGGSWQVLTGIGRS
jgi:hypothetical protein